MYANDKINEEKGNSELLIGANVLNSKNGENFGECWDNGEELTVCHRRFQSYAGKFASLSLSNPCIQYFISN